jgi:hypothetical protein
MWVDISQVSWYLVDMLPFILLEHGALKTIKECIEHCLLLGQHGTSTFLMISSYIHINPEISSMSTFLIFY